MLTASPDYLSSKICRVERKRNTPPLQVGLKAGKTTLEISLAVPQKTGHDTSGGPCYTTLGHVPRTFSSVTDRGSAVG